MKKNYMFKVILLAALFTLSTPLLAQVSVSIQILPPYPTRFADYESHPQLMLIMVVNSSNVQQRIQLRGTLTGDNGIQLKVKPGYKSTTPIVLGPGQTRSLNGNDLKYFFDYNQLQYIGISQNEFITKNGLPEGSYRFCLRAYNYDTNQPISSDEPVGCSNRFTIRSIDPPVILSPRNTDSLSAANGQVFPIRWNTPGSTSPSIRYRIRMVEIRDKRNPNDAFMSATQPYFFEKEVVGNMYIYNPADPQLTPGRNYGLMVEAFDPFNQTTFRNKGRSEVISFNYNGNQLNRLGPVVALKPPTPPAATSGGTHHKATIGGATPDCSCVFTVPDGDVQNNLVQANTSVIKVNNFSMKVVTVSTADDQTLTGTGVVSMPFLSFPGAGVRVSFSKMKVVKSGGELQMVAGTVDGLASANATPGMLPTANSPDLKTMSLDPGQITQLGDFFSQNTQNLLSQFKNTANSTGFDLPFGLDQGPVTVAIMGMHFTTEKAWFDAAAVVDIPDGQTKIALSGQGICMNPTSLCGQGTLYLSDDLRIDPLNIALKRYSDRNSLDTGTYVVFDSKGFNRLHIKADYTFKNSLVKVDGSGPAVASLIADTYKGWSDWVAKVTVDPFRIGASNDFTFSLGDGKYMYYDHSDTRNPTGLNKALTNADGTDQIPTDQLTWRGFYIPQINVTLPPSLKSSTSNITIAATDLIFATESNGGICGTISAKNILHLNKGSMDGWFFSIDQINLKFWRSAFEQSGMNGRLMLPPSGSDTTNAQNQLDYSCTLSKPPGSDLNFQFSVTPKDDLNFSALWAHLKIGSGSNITFTNQNGWHAAATLNGSLTLETNIKDVPDIKLGYMSFENLKIQTMAPVFTPGQIRTGIGSDDNNQNGSLLPNWADPMYASNTHGPSPVNDYVGINAAADDDSDGDSLFGFGISVKDIDLYMETVDGVEQAGIKFTTKLSLAKTNFMPEAEARFKVYAKIKADNLLAGRNYWAGIGAGVESISLKAGATIGPLSVHGEISYYNIAAQYDRGFIGKLSVLIPGIETGFDMKAQFGSKKPAPSAKSFNYFYIDALVDFGEQGIVMFPGTALYGFGGGVSYNMQVKENANMAIAGSDSRNASPTDYANATTSFSGRVYTPAETNTNAFGLQAGILFGLASRATLDADLTFAIDFENGSFRRFSLDGRGRLICDPTKEINARQQEAIGKGHVFIEVNYDSGTRNTNFDMGGNFALDVMPVADSTKTGAILHANGAVAFHVGPDGWYFHMGRPDGQGEGPWTASVLNFLTFKSYFECGSTNIDDIPPVPKWISDLATGNTKSGDQDNGVTSKNESVDNRDAGTMNAIHSGKGFITGFSNDLHISPEFLIFYGHLHLGFGADLSLKKYPDNVKLCATPGNFGANGWYATGQAYMGADAEVGVKINVFGMHKKISFVQAGVGAAIKAGLPNPAWIEGVVGGHFSVLDGLVKGNFNLKFSVGDVCDPTAGQDLTLIADLQPGGDQVALLTRPAVSFNFPLSRTFTVPIFNEKTGKYHTETYLISDTKIKLTNNKTSMVITESSFEQSPNTPGSTAYAMAFKANLPALEPSAAYTFIASAKVQKMVSLPGIGTKWFYTTNADGSDYVDSKTINFTTNCGYKAVPVSNIAELLPYHREQSLPVGALRGMKDGTPANTGMVKLVTALPPNDFCFDNFTVSGVYARLIPNNPKMPVSAESKVSGTDGKTWSFPMTVLQPNTTYYVQIIARDNSSQNNSGSNTGNALTKLAVLKNVNNLNLLKNGDKLNTDFTVNTQQLIEDRLKVKANEREILIWYFKTGNFDTYDDKFNSLAVKSITVNGSTVSIKNSPLANQLAYQKFQNSIVGNMQILYSATETFTNLDVNDVGRSEILPASATNPLWKNMFGRTKAVTGAPSAALSSFVKNTLGLNELNLNFLPSIDYHFSGPYYSTGETYLNLSGLLPDRVNGVSITDLETQQQNADGTASAGSFAATGGQSTGPSSGTTPLGVTKEPVSLSSVIASGISGSLVTNLQKDVLLWETDLHTRNGIPMTTATNMAINVIKLHSTWLVDPGPDQVSQMGQLMDIQAATVNQLSPQMPQIGGLKAGAIR